MRAGEKSTAVASLWSQFQKGSAIPNTLRDIKINSDGSVERTAPTQTEAEAQTQAASQAAASVPSEIQGDGGYYKSGYTRNESGALVDDQGKTKPASYTTRQGRASKTYNYSLVNGTWKAA